MGYLKRKIYFIAGIAAFIIIAVLLTKCVAEPVGGAVDNTGSDISNVYRDDKPGNETILKPGIYKGGIDIAEGRYIVTPTNGGYGNFIIYDLEGMPLINDVLGVINEEAGVESITCSIDAGQEITINGVTATFTPVEVKLLDRLTAGHWQVGKDIEEGTYTVATEDIREGNLVVLDGKDPAVSVEFNSNEGKNNYIITIKNKQYIRIEKLNAVEFIRK